MFNNLKRKLAGAPRIVIEWRQEPPRTRSVVVGGRPRRVRFPQTTAFLITRGDRNTHLHSWATDGSLRPDAPLLVSPINCRSEVTHVYKTGVVCFGQGTSAAINAGKVDPVEAFWGSNMHVLPSWLSRPVPREGYLTAPEKSAVSFPFSYQMITNREDHRGVDDGRAPTPRRVIEGLLTVSNPYFVVRPDDDVLIKTPWGEMRGEARDLAKRVKRW